MLDFTDHKVRYLPESFIADAAAACRKIGIRKGSRYVDLQVILDELQAHGVESIFSIRGTRRKGKLTIDVVDDGDLPTEAQVRFRPRLILRIRKSIWIKFQEGRDREREIIAHELGHIFLHDDDAKPFSRDGTQQINFAEDEDSAEWQAHRFGDHLLIPVGLARAINDPDRLAFICNVTESFAAERLVAVRAMKRDLRPKPGETCLSCGSDLLVDEGNNMRCDWCGG